MASLSFFSSLQGNDFISPLWQAAENYLHVGGKTYSFSEIEGDRKIFEKSSLKVENGPWKIMTYIASCGLLPLIAAIVKGVYRIANQKNLVIKEHSNSHSIEAKHGLFKDQVKSFELSELEKNSLIEMHESYRKSDPKLLLMLLDLKKEDKRIDGQQHLLLKKTIIEAKSLFSDQHESF